MNHRIIRYWAEEIICYLVAAHILCWTIGTVFERLIVEAVK